MTHMGELFERWNGGHEAITIAEWHPQTDIIEDDKEYLLKTELPEVRKEDVKVRVENGVLTIRGERKMEKEEKGKKIHRIERAYGSFLRSFDLPDDADPKQITSEFKDGVLCSRGRSALLVGLPAGLPGLIDSRGRCGRSLAE